MTQINDFSHQDLTSLPLITILGPTASGKTSLGISLANQFNGEIISADSRQVYRGMDIGTGKDLDDYGNTPYHLIDIVEPDYEYNLFEFIKDFSACFESIHHKQKLPFLVGGTGMYLDAILNQYRLYEASEQDFSELSSEELRARLLTLKPEQHNSTNLIERPRLIEALKIALSEQKNTRSIKAPDFTPLTLGLQFPRSVTRQRITQRLKQRLKEGMVEEVEQLHSKGTSWQKLDFFGLEYRFIAKYLQNQMSYNDMFQKLNSSIHQFAKQQEKWFRNIEKKGHAITWLDVYGDVIDEASTHIQFFLKHLNSN